MIQLLASFPTPAVITALSEGEFQTQAWHLVGRKVNKRALLAEIYAAAQQSIGVPVALDSSAIKMFRLMLEQYLALNSCASASPHRRQPCWRIIQTAAGL
jgi:hypothetical protein